MTVRAPVLTVVPHKIGIEAVRLGDRLVGYVHHHAHERHRCSWIVHLPDWPMRSGPCVSAALARARIRNEVEEWLMSADIIDAGDEIAIVVDDELQDRARA